MKPFGFILLGTLCQVLPKPHLMLRERSPPGTARSVHRPQITLTVITRIYLYF